MISANFVVAKSTSNCVKKKTKAIIAIKSSEIPYLFLKVKNRNGVKFADIDCVIMPRQQAIIVFL